MGDPMLKEIGEVHGKNPAQVTLRWLVQQDHVVAIPKAGSEKNRVGNLEIFDFELSDDEMARVFALDKSERMIDPDFGPEWDA